LRALIRGTGELGQRGLEVRSCQDGERHVLVFAAELSAAVGPEHVDEADHIDEVP
jgi:hypothetical protein